MKPTQAALLSTLGVTLVLIVPAIVVLVLTTRQAIVRNRAHTERAPGSRQGHADARGRVVRGHLPSEWQSSGFFRADAAGRREVGAFLAGNIAGLVKNLAAFFVNCSL